MDSTLKLFLVLSQTLLLSSQFSKASDYNNLVYNNCSSQTLADSNESLSKSLHSLFQELVPQSSKSKFFKATAGDDPSAAVSGFFQCRGDLSNKDCYDCVNTLPDLSNSLCNKAAAGRIQLHGCYFYYETDEFSVDDETSKHDLIHKVCGQKAKGSGFEEQRDKAFEAMKSGVIEGKGFYSGEYESVHAMAQCEGDLVDCDCGECVSNAAQIAQEECIGSVSGQIYLDRCFISYSYFPRGSGNSDQKNKGSGDSNTGKTVAIVLGVAAALGLGFVFLSFLRSCGDKDDIVVKKTVHNDKIPEKFWWVGDRLLHF